MTGLRYILEMVVVLTPDGRQTFSVDGFDTLEEPKRILARFESSHRTKGNYYEGWIIRMSTGETVVAVKAERVWL